MNNIIIKPYQSVGDFHFGTSQKDMIERFGEAPKVVIGNSYRISQRTRADL